MGRGNTIRGFSAKATAQHMGSFPLRLDNDEPLKDEDRIVPPLIEVRKGEAWYGVTVQPRGERRVLQAFREDNLVGYAPMETYWVETVKLKLKQKRETQKAILPGYVFLCVPDDSRVFYDLKEKHRDGSNVYGIGGIIMNNGHPCPIPTRLLKQLADEEREGWFDERRRKQLELKRNPELGGPTLRAGERLRIVGGPFSGFEGAAEHDSVNGSVRALLEILGGQTKAVVPLDQVENLDREVVDDARDAKPISRAEPISELAMAQNTGPVDWRTIEERRMRRLNRGIVRQNGETQKKSRA